MLLQFGSHDDARIAFDRAIALAHTAAEAAHIRQHIDRFLENLPEVTPDGAAA